jgi:DNA-binding transcriptional LysR family regulator
MKVEDLELFVLIANSGSITAASSHAGMSIAAASAALKRLESQLGAELFVRTPRSLRISPAGQTFLLHCQDALAAIELGKSKLQGEKNTISGVLRISVLSDLGRNVMSDWITDFADEYRELSVYLSLSDGISDLIRDHIDVAIRYTEPKDSNMVAFHLAGIPRCVCASPEYLQNWGTPKMPQDLVDHNCIRYSSPEISLVRWEFSVDGRSEKIRVAGNLMSDDGEAVRRWALNGKGIVYKPILDVLPDLQSGRLVRVLKDYPSPPRNLWMFCPGRNQIGPAALLLKDRFRKELSELSNQIAAIDDDETL